MKTKIIFFISLFLFFTSGIRAIELKLPTGQKNVESTQTCYVTGDSYQRRAEAIMQVMSDVDIQGDESLPKMEAPYFFAQLILNKNTKNALDQLDKIYTKLLNPANKALLEGSNLHFFDHATMHGYMLTKNKLPEELRTKIKQFMQLSDFTSPHGTLNMELMMRSAGVIAAEQWSDFTDAKGNNAQQIIAFNRPVIMRYLKQFFYHNCPEADAFIYFSTNLMYVRMLAEFSTDHELSAAAWKTFQQMVSSLLPAWNQGLYVANPPRSKGWQHLFTGSHSAGNTITTLCWTYFGNKDDRLEISTNPGNENLALNFWLFYPGKVNPDPALIKANNEKEYPYIHRGLTDVLNLAKYYKYTYQSQNYGLATQSEHPYRMDKPQYTYTYKETKRVYLAWQSKTTPCIFSVCQDNPKRPQPYQTNSNKTGYGENPYHRVLQSGKAAIGVYNVPLEYMDTPGFYRLYVPFTQKGIQLRVEEQGWIFCHTGSMMFAFKTIEPYTWTKLKFSMPEHDVLVLQDTLCRKGAWVLETTEIDKQYKNETIEKELDAFKKAILSRCHIETINYEGSHPRMRYTSLDGDLIDLTFFAPDETYSGQYVINGAKQTFDEEYISNNPFLIQKNNEGFFYILSPSGRKNFNW